MSDWRSNFKAHCLRTNFQLGLTRPQLEMLCAVADDVQWDRWTFGGIHNPRNWIASEEALTKRGLIQRKKQQKVGHWNNAYEIKSSCELTDAGRLIVELLKVTGLFIESDNAIERKASAKAARAGAR